MTGPSWDPKKLAEEAQWLIDHPQFDEKPASVREFLGEGYLECEALIRPGLIETLEAVFGLEVNPDRIALFEKAMITGGIGIGKTTFASIALPYMAHWVLCLRDPQAFFNLLPGSRIAFMQMSTSEKKAAEVVFGDLKARVQHSPWFIKNYPHDPKFDKQMRFPKDIWILPGDSAATTFEGYNILGGILDEMDSHKITEEGGDYADAGFDAIENRIASRFPQYGEEGEDAGHKGLIICIGQMKKAVGFGARKYKEFLKNPKAYVMRMTIWESLGWSKFTRKDGTRASFWYDIKTKQQVPSGVVGLVKNDNLIEIPNAYKAQFDNNPEKALRDLAGIPPTVSDPFISMVDRIENARDKWKARYGQASPVKPANNRLEFEPWFRANRDRRKRALHIDFGLSNDALGMALGHVENLVEVDDEMQPYIVIDALMRIKARPGQQIILSEIRNIIYMLKFEYKFNIYTVTMDGFQSTDTQQQLRKKKFHVDDLSVDKSTWPYEDLRDAINEHRIEWPPYMTYLKNGDTDLVEIAVQELMQLHFDGKKIDHPSDGSKDVADAMAGVTHTLMGDRTYRRGVSSAPKGLSSGVDDDLVATGTDGLGVVLPFPKMGDGLQAPMPPGFGDYGGLTIPSRLQPPQGR